MLKSSLPKSCQVWSNLEALSPRQAADDFPRVSHSAFDDAVAVVEAIFQTASSRISPATAVELQEKLNLERERTRNLEAQLQISRGETAFEKRARAHADAKVADSAWCKVAAVLGRAGGLNKHVA